MAESETGIIASDFLLVDDLLDFSNEEIAKPIGLECGTDANEVDTSTITGSLLSCNDTSLEDNRKNSHFSNAMSTNIEAHNTPGDLCVPCDDLAELEWLSNFMEDSFSTRNGVTETSVVKSGKYLYAPEIFSVPARARSKRSRAPVCNWVSRCILSPTSSASGRMSSFHSDCAADEVESVSIQVNNKISKTSYIHSTRKEARQEPSIPVRKCSHCSTQKTPQWRAGPEGPKTLCNACGVRFKSGRLLPEYRPAASPTFVLTKHSNSHRKVIEMRRLKNQTPPYHPLPTIVQGLLQSHSFSSSSSAGDDHSCYEETDNECLLHNNKTTEVNFCY